MGTKTFSLLHASARPEKWRAAHDEWKVKCADWERVEYILSVDSCTVDAFSLAMIDVPITAVIVHNNNKSSTQAWNRAAFCSTGKVLIMVADDFFPPYHWDLELLRVIPDIEGEWAVGAEMGGYPLLTHAIITRAYYKRKGYVLYPEYLAMYADYEFSDVVRKDGVCIECPELKFEHRHPVFGYPGDKIYEQENAPHRYNLGLELYQRRKKAGFP